MHIQNIDTSIHNYSLDDIKAIYDIEDDEYTLYDIETKHSELIQKCKQYNKIKYFFEQCKSKLIAEYYELQYAKQKKLLQNQSISLKEKEYKNLEDNKTTVNDYITKQLIINSKFRQHFQVSESNDFIIELPYTLTNVTSLKLKSIESINSCYAISDAKKNNIFYINDNKITVPDGNYTSVELIDTLNEILITYNIEAIFDKIKGTSTLRHTSSVDFELNFNVDNLEFYDTFGYIMGFRRNPYPYDIGSSYTSESLMDIRGDKYFYVYLDEYINSSTYDTIISFKKNDYFCKNIIGRIANIADIYTIQFEDNSDNINKIRYYFGPVNIKKLHIKLLDENGELLMNNNTDYSITLEIQQKI